MNSDELADMENDYIEAALRMTWEITVKWSPPERCLQNLDIVFLWLVLYDGITIAPSN